MANPKDEFQRQQQAVAAADAKGSQVQGLAVSTDTSNASRFAKVPPGIGGNPLVQQSAQAEKNTNPIAEAAMTTPAAPAASPKPSAQSPSFTPAPATNSAAGSAAAVPLSPQAQSDRARVGAAWDTVKDVNDDAGRAIADMAMLVPRGVAGAYDSAVVRPMRAAGVNASYLSPHLVPDGVDPSSMTPFTDQKRMQQAANSGAPGAAAVQPAQTVGAGAGTSEVGGGRGSINPPMADPSAPTPTLAGGATVTGNPMAQWDRTGMTNAEVAQANPGGRVTMQRQPNGTMSFSGTDVSGPVSYADGAGKPLPGAGIRGNGFSRVDSTPAGASVGMDGAGNYAFSSGNPLTNGASAGRSPVGMSVEQAQREGLIGQRVGNNPAYDQRQPGERGAAATPGAGGGAPGVDSALAAAAARGDFDAVRSHYAGRGQDFGGQNTEQQAQAGFSGSIGQGSGSGNAWGRTPEQQRKDAETQASSIHKPTAARGAQALRSLDAMEAGNAKIQGDLQQEALRQSGGLQREALREQGEYYRAAGRNALVAAELAQRGSEANSRAALTAQEVTKARRANDIMSRYDNAATDAERMSIIRQHPDVFGRKTADPQGKDRYMTVGGGTSVVDGQTVREPTMVFDTVTQQYVGGGVPGGGQAAQQTKAPEYEKGQIYVDPQSGAQRMWNGKSWDRV